VPVRIFFRGLVLFRFPTTGPNANKLVAELISEPPNRTTPAGVPPGQDDHEAEIQVISGLNDRQLLPTGLRYGAHVNISIRGCSGGIQRTPSFDAHVPKISRLATMTRPALVKGPEDDRYVRNTITVDCGKVRVKDVVIWDESGFPLAQKGNIGTVPAAAAQVKFMGVDVMGHAANECVVEAADTDTVAIESPEQHEIAQETKSVRRRNQRAQSNTTDVLIRNYEYQREKPVPWGMDFQWMFARLGYSTVNLAGPEFDAFNAAAGSYDSTLLADDRRSLLPGNEGHPFPYIIADNTCRLTTLFPSGRLAGSHPPSGLVTLKPPGSTATDIDSRPVCVPGDE
jgi:hypothetical protein